MVDLGSNQEDLRDLQRHLTILKMVLLVAMAVLAIRVWSLQIREGSYYRDQAMNNRTRTVLLEPARGLIFDRNGFLLANNAPSFNLYVSIEDVMDKEALIHSLGELIGLDEGRLRNKLSDRSAHLTPKKVKGGLSLREAALIESHRLDYPGVSIQPESQRNYPLGSTAAHILGYVGEVSAEQLEQATDEDLHQGSIIGQYGVEKTYDASLRGRTGEKTIEVDALGHEKRVVATQRPEPGNDIYLTIDVRLQQLAEALLGEESGAIVALDPTSGEVLALASRPAFDPNVLSRDLSSKQWEEIVRDESRPLTNRATQGQYPPGSTFKIVMAAAALETKTVTPESRIRCTGGYQFGKRLFRDWKAGGHGAMDIRQALVHSCDVFFYTVGQRVGIDAIAAFATQFGLGRETGVELPSERTGIVPSTAWKERVRHEPWWPGETVSVSIGQGYVTVTPMQMAHATAAIASGGEIYKPRLVRGIIERSTGVYHESPSIPTARLSLKPETLLLIQEAMAGVVKQGTATRARSTLISIAGKTGTAQTAGLRPGPEALIPKKLRDHAWFVAYAPTESPGIAVAVLVEHMGHGGTAAAPLAKQLIEAYVKFTQEDLQEPQPDAVVQAGPVLAALDEDVSDRAVRR
jgi:penicillin-binding protein 2